MKTLLASGIAALALMPSAAFAGPYLNVEANSGFVGDDYSATVIEGHVGYEGDGFYVQAGPAVVAADGESAELEFSGKLGGSVALSESVDLYGEVSFITGDENSYGTKIGAKYSF